MSRTFSIALRVTLCLLLLIQCGDIEMNPGPPKTSSKQAKLTSSAEIIRDDGDIDNLRLAQLIETMKQDIRGDICSLKDAFEQHKKETNTKIKEIDKEVKELKRENKELKESVSKMENHIKRQNLIFFDIPESADQETNDDIETKVKSRIHQELGDETDDILFGATTRLGKKTDGKIRPVLCKFLSQSDRDNVLSTHRTLRKEGKEGLKLSEDFPNDIREKRKKLAVLLEPLREQYLEDKIYLSYDKLVFQKKRYSTQDIAMLLKHINEDAELKDPMK